MAPFTPCLTCAKEFKTIRDLKQHQLDAYHFEEPYEEHWSKSEMLFAYFTGYYAEYVLIQRDEQRKARKVVRKELEKLKESFPKSGRTNEYHTFEIINIEPAGSTATQTKVYQADEYDFNLIVENENIKVDDLTSIFIEVTGNVSIYYLKAISISCLNVFIFPIFLNLLELSEFLPPPPSIFCTALL